MDHSPGTRLLQQHTGARSYGYGPHGAGKISAGVPIEEGGDMAFVPDVEVRSGDIIEGEDWHLEWRLHTRAYLQPYVLSATRGEGAFHGRSRHGLVNQRHRPPDGDMTQYMDSLALLLDRDRSSLLADPRYLHTRAQTLCPGFHRTPSATGAADTGMPGQGPEQDRGNGAGHVSGHRQSLYPAAASSVFAAMMRLLDQDRVLGERDLRAEFRLP